MASPDRDLRKNDELFAVPTSTQKKLKPKIGRRSSILNIVRRQSKSIIGIPFEDQIATIDPEAPVADRLQHLYRICAKSAIKIVHETLEEESDCQLSDVNDDVCGELRKKIRECDVEVINGASKTFERMKQSGTVSNLQELVPCRVKAIQTYITKLNEEVDSWKKMLNDRKVEYLRCRQQKKDAANGILKINDDNLTSLNCDHLKKISSGCGYMKKCLEQEKKMINEEKLALTRFKSIKKRVLSTTGELDVAMAKLIRYVESTELPNMESEPQITADLSKKFLEDIKQ